MSASRPVAAVRQAEDDHWHQLWRRIKASNDQVAWSTLWVLVRRRILSGMVTRYFIPGIWGQREDLEMIAAVGFIQGVHDWNPQGGRHLRGFLGFCMERELKTLLVYCNCEGRQLFRRVDSLDQPLVADGSARDRVVQDTIPGGIEPDQVVLQAESLARVHAAAIRCASSDLEQQVVGYMLGQPDFRYTDANELATALGITDRCLDNTMQRVRRHRREPLEEFLTST